MGSTPPHAGPPPGGDFSQMNQQGQPGYGQQPLPPPAKKSSVWIWVLGGCLGLLLLGGAATAIIGYFAVQKAKEVAGDFENKPVFTAAKALIMLNPDIELVEADENSQRITIREKATGKTMSVSLEDLKEGKISFTDEKGEQYSVQTDGEGGGVRVQGPDGQQVFSVQPGGNIEFPEWAPVPAGTYSSSAKTATGEGTIWVVTVDTATTVPQLVEQLERDATSHGFRVTGKSVTTTGDGSALMFSAVSADNKRTITAMGGSKTGASQVEFIFSAQERP